MAIVYSKDYRLNLLGLEKLHPFDVHKYARIHKALIENKVLKEEAVLAPLPISEADILRVHTQQFLESLKDSKNIATYLEAPAAGFLPQALLNRGVLLPFRYATGGTLLAARQALSHGIAINLGGGYHHATPEAGEGFCIYADMPIAIRRLQAEKLISKALVIDLDVHQGNGTAVCFANDKRTFTFSMHQADIYPIPKATSDLDLELDAGTGDRAFLALLADHLDALFKQAAPDIVFFQAGCDTLSGDPLASLEMTEEGIIERDGMVIEACVRHNVPVLMLLGGGYSENAWHAQYASIRSILEEYGQAVRADLNQAD